jgi:hypothetical protein
MLDSVYVGFRRHPPELDAARAREAPGGLGRLAKLTARSGGRAVGGSHEEPAVAFSIEPLDVSEALQDLYHRGHDWANLSRTYVPISSTEILGKAKRKT